MHIAPRTVDHRFKETRAGLLKVLMCDCITNAFYLMIILVSGDSLDIKELTYAIIITLFYILLGFEHIYCRLLYILKSIRREPGRKVFIVYRLCYILIEGLVFRVQCTI